MLKKPKDIFALPTEILDHSSPMKAFSHKKKISSNTNTKVSKVKDDSWLDLIAKDYGMPFDANTAASLLQLEHCNTPKQEKRKRKS